MSPIYIADGKILVSSDGKLASLPCPSGCCGREPPGVCCSGIWHDTPPEIGVCCSGVNAPSGIWVPSNLPVGSGVCCGGDWYPPSVPGKCCAGVWYPGDPPTGCPEGQIYLTWGPNNACCGCVPIQVYNPQTDTMVDANANKGSFCCPVCTGGTYMPGVNGCLGRCCNNCSCTPEYEFEGLCYQSGGQWLAGCCETLGCPQSCCGEDDDCNVTCETIDSEICDSPRVLGECGVSCPDACLGACCENGIVTGQTTQAACNGCWSGPGSTQCEGACIDDGQCCESKTSKDAGLTFTKPLPLWNRCKNCSILQPETLRVTVTGTTDSPILIHGTPIGTDGARCSINHSFLICWENFNIEPVPCGSNFRYLDVTVCWETEATDTETLDFSGCNGLDVWLGACDYGCVTTLTYSKNGHTSDVNIKLYGDAVIEANGTGPLVLTSPITIHDTCVETLTITGTNTQNNEISGAIQDSSLGLEVIKTGAGVWKLSGSSLFSDGLKVKSGTIIIGQNVGQQGASPVGDGDVPVIGDTNSGAKFLLEGRTYGRALSVISGTGSVVLGGVGANASFFSNGFPIRLGRGVTLQASTGGSVSFGSTWQDSFGGPSPAVAFTIGSTGNNGIVVLESFLPDSITSVVVVTGTLRIAIEEAIYHTTPTTIETATIDRNTYNQPLDALTINGTATLSGTGDITINNALSGAGNIVNTDGVLIINGTNSMSGTTSIAGGSLVVNQAVSGPASFSSATFTNTNLTVNFSADPGSNDQFQLLAGPTIQSYSGGNIVLNGTTKTATYNSSTSTLTID